jgi:hypothetical protein
MIGGLVTTNLHVVHHAGKAHAVFEFKFSLSSVNVIEQEETKISTQYQPSRAWMHLDA